MTKDEIKALIKEIEDEIAANERFFSLLREADKLGKEDIDWYQKKFEEKYDEIARLKSAMQDSSSNNATEQHE